MTFEPPSNPMAPATADYAASPKLSAMGIAGMILGIFSIALFLIYFVAIILGILALILGGIALWRINRDPVRLAGKGFAFTGLVTGGIGTFLSLLVPITIAIFMATSLGTAKRQARTTVCLSNLRSISFAMVTYSAEWDNAIPGSPSTTGRFLLTNDGTLAKDSAGMSYGPNNCPNITGIWDWQAPLAAEMSVKFDAGPSAASRKSRFLSLNSQKIYTCPENDILSISNGNDLPGLTEAFRLPSYNTAGMFLYSGVHQGAPGVMWQTAIQVPPGYTPKMSHIGRASSTIFIADGARYTDTAKTPVSTDSNLAVNGANGGAWSDVGAFSKYSRAWTRDSAPGNGGTCSPDSRVFAYRHGVDKLGAPANSYKFNAAFFDGHVETMGDLDGANPALWTPLGTVVPGNEMPPDVQKRFAPSGSFGP